jgi:RNA-splicing ligase RtcB
MWITVHVGIVGSILLMVYALTSGGGFGTMLMLLIGLNCLMNCIQWRSMLQQTDPYAYEGYMAETGYERAQAAQQRQREKESVVRAKRRQREEEEVRREQEEVDRILAKVGESGMNSLTGAEKKALARATENQRKREQERASRRY